MRKPPRPTAISPQLLKQFAVATLVVTGLVALFANGEAAQVEAQVQARESRNQLLATEADKLGTRKIATGLKVKPQAGGWGGDGGDVGGDSSGGDSGAAAPGGDPAPQIAMAPQRPALPRGLPTTPGASLTVSGQLATDVQGPGGDAARAKAREKVGTMYRPNAQQIEEIQAVSRARTGGSSAQDY